MKILKLVFGILFSLILLFALVFFAAGFFNPTVSYGHEIEVNKPIKEAWAVQQDVSKFGDWLAGFKSIEHLSGEAGAVGSTYKVTVRPDDFPEDEPDFVMTETITSIKDYDHIGLSFDSDMMVFDQTTSFSERDGKTVIKTDSKVKGKGIVMRSMFALMEIMGGSFQKQEVENIENLKKVIEANSTDYFPVAVEGELVEEG